MLCKNLLAVAFVAGVTNAIVPGMVPSRRAIARRQNDGLALDAGNVQKGSESDGAPSDGQAASDTSNNNFINFCSGKTLTNGLQQQGGSCNGIVMGDIPSADKMVSAIITNPGPGDDITAEQDFDVTLSVSNLDAGSFTNPDTTYYAAPQVVGNSGNIVGHSHITIQDMGANLKPTTPLNPRDFVFFKGINDAGDGQGNLKVTVTGGLPAGFYRACTINSASNHQAVTMPIAQRGFENDCQKFTVGQGKGGGGGGNGTVAAKFVKSRRYTDSANVQERSASMDKNQRFQARSWIT